MTQEGEIWPGMTAQFTFVFKPDEAKLYRQTIYCDVAGEYTSGQNKTLLKYTLKGTALHLDHNI